MKIKITLLALATVLSGCSVMESRQQRMEEARQRYETNHGEPAEDQRQIAKHAAALAHKTAIGCGEDQAPQIDDGVSDAATIALAVSRLCTTEYDGYVEKYIAAAQENRNVKYMLQKRLTSEEYRIQYFLVPVLRARRDLK